MATVNVYLTFTGKCEEAFDFYKSVFGGEFSYLGRFKDAPSMGTKEINEIDGNLILHVSLPISQETCLMGSDVTSDMAASIVQGNNFSISIDAKSKEEADNFFNLLSADGQITMPMSNTFWGAYFGMLTDKFGINWLVNFDHDQE